MIGDLILNIKEWFRQNVFCIHDYKPTCYGDQRYYRQCTKCGRIK